VVAGVLEGSLQRAIHTFKYRGRPQLASPLGGELAKAIGRATVSPEALAYVPLHPQRQRERGFNQAERLARAGGRELGLPVVDGLRRVRPTRSQVGLTREERLINLQGAFAWADSDPPGQRLGLVDDVCTTGTTLEACGAALEAAGGRLACFLVLASPQTLTARAVTRADSSSVRNSVFGEL
jgi:ComF family protein